MSWNIKDLDKSKTEQCISNETARLDMCKERLENLKKEYQDKKYEYMCKLSDLEDKITNLEGSIKFGESFINECKDHLNFDFVHEEV